MVRVKHRYLLVNILYPDPNVQNVRILKDAANDIPYSVRFRHPSSDQLTARLLAQVIRDGVVDLFGDYGAGKIAGSLQGVYSYGHTVSIVRSCLKMLIREQSNTCHLQRARLSSGCPEITIDLSGLH